MKPNVGSDRSWVYTAHDFSEEEPTTELFAVRFANAENANQFKAKFEEAQVINSEAQKSNEVKEEAKEEEKPVAATAESKDKEEASKEESLAKKDSAATTDASQQKEEEKKD